MYCSEDTKQYLFNKLKDPFEGLDKNKIEEICIAQEYLFIKKDKKTGLYYGYCTCCHQWSNLTALNDAVYDVGNAAQARQENGYLHNDFNYCPNCKRNVQIKDVGKSRKYLSEKGYCAIWQKLNESIIVLRTFAIKKHYGWNDVEKIKAAYSEHYRIFYVKGKGAYPFVRNETAFDFYADSDCYFYRSYQKYNNYRLMSKLPSSLEYPTAYFGNSYYSIKLPKTEFFNVKVLKKVKWLEHSQYNAFFQNTMPQAWFLHHKFIEYYIKHPVLCERLMKESFGDVIALHLAKHYLNAHVINYNAKTVMKFFKLNNKAEVKVLKNFCNQNKNNMNKIARVVNNVAALKKYSVEVTEKALAYSVKEYSLDNPKFPLVCDVLNVSEHDLLKYLIKKDYSLSDYCDYAGWLEKYNFEINNKSLFPRYPKKAHDELMQHNMRMEKIERAQKAKKEAEKTKAKWKGFSKNILPKMQYVIKSHNDKYLIRPFESAEEMIYEGTTQHICVGDSRYQHTQYTGAAFICCVREIDKPDTPFCTVEISKNGVLVQARMAYNNPAPEEVKAFIKSVLKDFSKRREEYERKQNKKEEVA